MTRHTIIYLLCVFGVAALQLSCDHGLAPQLTSSGINGVITFTGERPSAPGEIRVGVFDIYAPDTTFLIPAGFSDPLEFNSDSISYFVELPAGNYKWIVCAWKDSLVTWLEISELVELATYYAESDSSQPGVVIIGEEGIRSRIDMHVDFNLIEIH